MSLIISKIFLDLLSKKVIRSNYSIGPKFFLLVMLKYIFMTLTLETLLQHIESLPKDYECYISSMGKPMKISKIEVDFDDGRIIFE